MKALFTVSSLVSMASTGIVSYKLFSNSHFYASALLTVASYLTATLLVSILSSKKISL